MSAAGPAARPIDVLIVSLGSTEGLRRADEELRDSLVRAGATVEIARARTPRRVRTMMLTDLAWARAARATAIDALARIPPKSPVAIIYSSTTSALLWPRPGAIRFDATSAGNRPGHHGLWQRPLERRRLAQAPLLLPWSDGGLNEMPALREWGRTLVLPVPAEASGPPAQVRDIAALTYAANPSKKGLDRVLTAWRTMHSARGADVSEELVVAGASLAELELAGYRLRECAGVRVAGALSNEAYRALVRRARVFICAPRREDYGIAQLEALADGCLLVGTPAPGPYAALAIAHRLDPRLISEDLASALHVALHEPLVGYAADAQQALESFSRERLDRLVANELLPRLVAADWPARRRH
jgi:hypothetical protein